ncbi:DUF4197 domain-containing protein [Sinimarinibacterium flocculans]|uniref:Uncharacterized protein DUF4197 n=1 Tax=Sinimarinibacterium flocculans TaxID=985250 RepID=A0A318E5L9_9GAMM|nr:DUF4197 domain-containing protein [Sinimarinibacterium flocculans]PXV64219.1 uncharacterized protein DUF4197 [Sinimarinibacterium flocculans]
MIRIALTVVVGLAAAGCAVSPSAEDPLVALAPLPETAPADAVREALLQGAAQAVGQLGRVNGYWSNAAVRVPMPAALARPAETLRKLGAGGKVDEFHHSLNAVAEQAVPYAAEALAAAVREMTLDDVRALLDGSDDAVTQHFRASHGEALVAYLRPYVEATGARIGVTQRYRDLIGDYGVLLRGSGIRELDLDAYITQKTVDGVFYLMAAEEARIRRDPRARGTELMRRVFGRL